MTVATCCKGGFRLTYHVPIGNGQPPLILAVDLPMDGTEVPTVSAGKPTGQTMAATRIDDHHYTGVVKQNGQASLTSKATLSAERLENKKNSPEWKQAAEEALLAQRKLAVLEGRIALDEAEADGADECPPGDHAITGV